MSIGRGYLYYNYYVPAKPAGLAEAFKKKCKKKELKEGEVPAEEQTPEPAHQEEEQ